MIPLYHISGMVQYAKLRRNPRTPSSTAGNIRSAPADAMHESEPLPPPSPAASPATHARRHRADARAQKRLACCCALLLLAVLGLVLLAASIFFARCGAAWGR